MTTRPASGVDVADLEDLYENAPCGHLSTAPDGTILRANRTFLTWTAYSRGDVESACRLHDLLATGSRLFFELHCAPMLRMQGMIREVALDLVCADGSRLPVLVNAVLHKDAAGHPVEVRLTVVDATERQAYEQAILSARDAAREAREQADELRRQLEEQNRQLERLAFRDSLTGVANRRALQDHLGRCVARAERHEGRLGVVLLDIDAFKSVNDRWGHGVGDVVLRSVAERVREAVREEDLVGRWGGEEFLILAPDTSEAEVARLCERIRQVVRRTPVAHVGDEDSVTVTVSLGWACWPQNSADDLVREADAALYRAKNAGRDQVRGPAALSHVAWRAPPEER